MENRLMQLYGNNPMTKPGFGLKNYTMPNSGVPYNSIEGTNVAPKPIFSQQAQAPAAPAAPPVDLYAKYRDPKTGEVMSPQEYAVYLGNKVPKGSGDVTQYAGDAMTKPDQSVSDLTNQARDLNNSRNDIATGTTDPYQIGNESGIAYSPTELKAIEKAYAGIYDPAIKDVFARLETKKNEADKLAKREEEIFRTNENIRQWKATTGLDGGSGSKKLFTQTQINNGVKNSGLGYDAFNSIEDNDLKNFFVNPPADKDPLTGKSFPMNASFDNLIKMVRSGNITPEDATTEIENANIPQSVKTYFINQLPLEPKVKEGVLKRVWSAIFQ